MSVGRVVRWALLCALPFACGERTADPVVALPGSAISSAGAAGGGPEPGGGGEGGQDGDETPSETSRGPSGLCATCSGSSECGGPRDACILNQGQTFCGRECDDLGGCPDGYACVELDNRELWQCVPIIECPAAPTPAPPLPDVRQHVLTRVNSERARLDLAPLSPSTCLHDLAQASALEFARTDRILGKFDDECRRIFPNCECGWSGQAELTVARYGLDWTTAIEHALVSDWDSPNERFVQGFLSDEVSEVGIGFWHSGDEAWLALSFR